MLCFLENNQRPKLMNIPNPKVKNKATNTPIKGETSSPEIPVTGWSFQVTVESPNRLNNPIRIEKGTMENSRPKATSLKIVPMVSLFISS